MRYATVLCTHSNSSRYIQSCVIRRCLNEYDSERRGSLAFTAESDVIATVIYYFDLNNNNNNINNATIHKAL